MTRLRQLLARLRREDGSILPWVMGIVLILIMLAGIGIDFGRQAVAEQRVRGAAREAARVACQQVQGGQAVRGSSPVLDPARAAAAGNAYLASAGLPGTVTAISTTQCRATATGSYRTVFLSIVGISSIPIDATATADANRTLGGAPR